MKHPNFTRSGNNMKMLFILVLFVFATGSAFCQSPSLYWKFVNPSPMGIYITDLAYVNDNVGYASCDAGVIARTTDAGHTWTYDVPGPRVAWSAIDFPTETTGYVVGSTGKIMKTTTRGISWTEITSPTTANLQALYFFNATTGFIVGDVAAGSATIYKTTDGGVTWTSMASGFPIQTKNLRAISFASATIGYISGAAGLVAKTVDGGTTWTNISITGTNPTPVSGTSTTYVSQNYPGLAVVDAQNIVISSQNNSYVIKSSDGGVTWRIKLAFSGTTPSLGGSFQMLNIASRGSDVAIAMGAAFVSTSHDKGETWSVRRVLSANNVNSSIQFNAVAITPNKGVKLAGLYGIVADSASGGPGWDTTYFKNINYSPVDQKQLISVSHLDKNNIIAGGVNGQFYRSTDGGKTWVDKSIPEFMPPYYQPVAITDVKYTSSDAAYMVGNNGYIYRSFDGGNTWPDPYAFNTGASASAIDFIDKNAGWVCGGIGTAGMATVHRTTNGGVSWTPQLSTFTGANYLNAIDFVSATTGYVVGTAAKIFKTTDGGINWTAQAAPAGLTAALYAVNFANKDTGMAGSSNGKVIRTLDGGTTWTEVTPTGIAGTINRIQFINSKTVIIFGISGYCFRSNDAGNTWTPFIAPTFDVLSAASLAIPYTSTPNIISGTDVDMLAVGGRAIGGLAPAMWSVRAFSAPTAPTMPIVVNVNDKCAAASTAKGKIMNPPAYTQIDITVDGVPALFYSSDSTFYYYESGTTTGGAHTVRVKYTNAGGNISLDTTYNFYATNLTPTVGISSSDADNIICNGAPVTFTATGNNGGTSPSYQWKVNGNAAGTNSNTFTYTPADNDVVSVVMTSSFSCTTAPTAISNTITNIVPQFNPVIFEQTGNTLAVTNPTPGGIYQWYKDGVMIVGANGSTLTVSGFGNYYVMQSMNTCTKNSNSIAMAPRPNSMEDIILYPVPAHTTVNAQTNSISTGILSFTVYNAAGAKVLRTNVSNQNIATLDISTLPAGIYMVKIITTTKTVTKKLVKD